VVGQKHLPEGKTQMRDLNYQLKQLCDRNRHGNCRIHTKQGIQTPGDIAWFIMGHPMSGHGVMLHSKC
jgi:hypothetical protein